MSDMEKHDKNLIRTRAKELMGQHGGVRAGARVLQIDPGYFSRLISGDKTNPSDKLLKRMGVRRIKTVTYYERI